MVATDSGLNPTPPPAPKGGDTRLVLEELGENALLLTLGDRLDPALSRRTQALAGTLMAAKLPGVIDVVPAFASVTLHYEPGVRIVRSRIRALAIAALAENARTDVVDAPPRVVTLPVVYGGDAGVDLEPLARFANLDPSEVVARHVAQEYEVAMLGFLPGFAYLVGLDPALAMPRHATPRARVPSGSVAIGGAQTGIYPSDAPGGWRLIGRTDVRMFDATAPSPALLSPGDHVRFRAVT